MNNSTQMTSMFERVGKVALSIVFVLSTCVPRFAAVAEPVDQSADVYALQAVDVPEFDLNNCWKAIEGGTDNAFTIDKGGQYYLSGDLETGAMLTIDAPDAAVIIKFNGHVLTINGGGSSAQKTMIAVNNAASVVFDGAAETGNSVLASAGQADMRCVSSIAADCEISMNDLTVKQVSEGVTQRIFGSHCVRMAAGSLRMSDCVVSMDYGNQTLRNTLLASCDEVPSAVYATSDVKSVELDGCTVEAVGAPGFSCESVSDTTGLGNVYGLYSLAEKTSVTGGSYRATSMQGNAACLYATSMEVGGDSVKLEANAGQIAAGLLSAGTGSVVVSAPLDFSVSSDYAGVAEAAAALRLSTPNGFVFRSGAVGMEAGTCPVLYLPDSSLSGANDAGSRIASFDGVSETDRAALTSALTNALGADAICVVAADTSGAYFNQVGSVAHIGSTFFATIDSALSALSPGDELVLDADLGPVVIEEVGDATLDLNGHAVESLEFGYSASARPAGLVVRNGSICGVQVTSDGSAALYYHARVPLTLERVDIRTTAANKALSGIYASSDAAGAIRLVDSSIDTRVTASTSNASAYGVQIYRTSKSSLALDNTAVKASTASSGAVVCGVYSPVATSIENGSVIKAEGTNATTGALQVGGTLVANGSTFETSTTAQADAYGIWALTVAPRATKVTIDGCDVSAQSLCSVSEGYQCLRAATTELGASSAMWELDGTCSFISSSGAHIGENLPSIKLGKDFALSGDSDAPLAVSQSALEGNVAFESASDAGVASCAGLFVASPDSRYDGWVLKVGEDGSKLEWRAQGSPEGGAASIVRDGSVSSVHASLSDALAHADSGDTLKLNCNLVESGTIAIGVDDLGVDLNGYTLTMRAGGDAVAGEGSAGGAVSYSGSGVLALKGGTLDLQVGASTEVPAGDVYQGIAVSGGGRLAVDETCTVILDYTGGSSTSVQRPVTMRGIALTSGSLELAGDLVVNAAQARDAIGGRDVVGVFAASSADKSVNVRQLPQSTVKVVNDTAAATMLSTFYPESSSYSSVPEALREITVDPVSDSGLYQAIVRSFRTEAVYDDPDTVTSGTFGARIYYAQSMVLDAPGAWYDKLKVWAYTDSVDSSDVGKLDKIVPSHVFISTPYDTVPTACGLASSSNSAGRVSVDVMGTIEVECSNGSSTAVSAAGDSNTVWSCRSASLSAVADTKSHIVYRSVFDLRNFLKLSTAVDRTMSYRGAVGAGYAEYEAMTAHDIIAGDNVGLSVSGSSTFAAEGQVTSTIEAASFTVGEDFETSSVCSISNPAGSNVAGSVFATGANGMTAVDTSKFVDARGALVATPTADGGARWSADTQSHTVSFKTGNAVVKTYANPDSIDLSEPSALAQRIPDARQSYEFVGWSLSPDEYATTGFLAPDEVIEPRENAEYYAVYSPSFIDGISVSFANVFDNAGNLVVDTPVVKATYGQTLGEALSLASVELPVPQDYTDGATGVSYCFVGWFPYTASVSTAMQVYGPSSVSEDLLITVATSGVAEGSLVLWASYVAVAPGERLVSFDVDGRISSIALPLGTRPAFNQINNSNMSYYTPAKVLTESGTTFLFDTWIDGKTEKSYSTILPAVTDDVLYRATFKRKASSVNITFYYLQPDNNANNTYSQKSKLVATTYENTMQKIADGVVSYGGEVGFGGKVYTMAGWAVRSTDVDALYSADNPIPETTSSYSRTYYAIYTTSEHYVDVTFVDGTDVLGTVNTHASATLDSVFAKTGAAARTDKSTSEAFLGWSTSANGDVSAAHDAVSTAVVDVVGTTAKKITLYAAYGVAPSYTVRLRSDDGVSILYEVKVARGRSVNDVLAQNGASINVSPRTGKYFAGWRTASGAYFDLSAPVVGTADLRASYNDIEVDASGQTDIGAVVTSTWSELERAERVVFRLVSRSSAELPLSTTAAKAGYTILNSYDMRVLAIDSQGQENVLTGSFGTASVSVQLSSKYNKASLRAFWTGERDGTQAVLNSDEKKLGDGTSISVSIGNYLVGDETEGGNLAIAYREGGGNSGSLDSNSSGNSAKSTNSSSSLSAHASLSTSGLGLSPVGSGLSAATVSAAAPGASNANPVSAVQANNGVNASNSDSLSSDGGESVASDGAYEDGESSYFSDWDSNAVVLVISGLSLALLAVWLMWRMLVVRQRESEQVVEAPSLADLYAGGIRF